MQPGADRVGALERLLAVTGHVADQHRRPAPGELERVIEVAARGRSLARPVRHRRGERSELCGHLREQGPLEQADLTKKLLALGFEHAGPSPLDEVCGHRARSRPAAEQAERQPHDAGDHLDELLDGPRDRIAAILAGRGADG